MTHVEAAELLPLLALDAVEEPELAAIEGHILGCSLCAAELRSLELTSAHLAAAVPPRKPPAGLRERLLASGSASVAAERNGRLPGIAPSPARHWSSWLTAAVVVLALGGAAAGLARDVQDRARLRTDDAALALLTSTETTNDRLAPVAGGLPPDAHGHWFHRAGVPTQVIVAEHLPPLPAGQHYAVWQRLAQGWTFLGQLDPSGRLIVLGGEGSGATALEVTRESGHPSAPSADVMLAGS